MSIKQVTKRVGEMEAYDPNKILKWLFWGSKSLETIIDWQKIMLKVDSELFEGIGTQQIQLKAIDICLSQQDTRYNLLAGRLYTAFLRKKLYDNEMPSVREQHHRCVELGFMEELGYSDEEFEAIEKMIDHTRDFDLVHSQVSQLYNKYALFNQDSNERYETPQYTCMRMAMALSINEVDRLTAVRENYDMFSLFKGNAPTPNYLNLGTPHRGLLSCCLYKAGDDVKSIEVGDHIAYTMTYMSAGIGGILAVRSLDDPVKKGKIKHKGKLPYFRRQAASVMANSQGGRGGSCTSYFTCFDPEVMTIIHLQNPRTPKLKQIRDIHFAIQFNAFFYEKMKNKEDVFLFNVFTAPDLHAAFYDPDSVRFAELYNKYENDPSFKKTYLNAAAIAVAAGRQFHEVSTLYRMNVTAANAHTPFKEPIETSNLCTAPETPILTKEFGYRHIQTLVGQDVNVWNGEEWSPTTVVKTGEQQKLYTVMLSTGLGYDFTGYHKWYVQTQDQRGAKYDIVVKTTLELQPGDKLIKFDLEPCDHGTKELEFAYENGFYTGDGCRVSDYRQRIDLYGSKKSLLEHFKTDKIYCRVYESPCADRIELHYKNKFEPKFFIPDTSYSIKTRLEWLCGLFDADGTVARNEETVSLQLVSVNYDFLARLLLLLQELGVNSKIALAAEAGLRLMPDGQGSSRYYHCKKSWRVLIGNQDTMKLLALGFSPKRLDLDFAREGNRSAIRFVTVTSIIDRGRFDDTYCFTELKRHMGMFGGVLTGQCLEIQQPVKAYKHVTQLYDPEDTPDKGEISLCALGAMVPSKIIHVAGEDKIVRASLDFTLSSDIEYEQIAYRQLRMIDQCLHLNHYVFPHLKTTALSRLNAGVGMMGIAYDMAKRNFRYDSEEGLKYIHFLAERHMFIMIKAALRLGKEYGNAPWIHKTKWPDGWLPIDTYNRNVDKIADFKLYFPWEELRAEVIKQGGLRFSCLVTHMPQESSSKNSNLPNSYYPIRDLKLMKSDESNIIEFIAPEAETLASKYQLAWDIPTKAMAHVIAILQKFCDSGISADSWSDRTDNAPLKASKLLDEIYYDHLYGIKSRYYTVSKTTEGKNISSTSSVSVTTPQIEVEDDIGYTNSHSVEEACPGGFCSL